VFWDLDGWLEVADDEVSTLVHALNAFFTKSTTPSDSDAQPFLIVRRAKDSRELAGHTAQLIVRRVRRRHLPFYRNDWRLLEFTCDVTPLLAIPGYRRQLVGYEDDARLFALCGPNQPSEDWILINWTSSQIYEANEGKASLLDLATQPAEVAREYLIFFCSFLGAEPDVGGAIAPFLVPQDENVLLKDAIGSLDDVRTSDLSGLSMPAIAEDDDPFDLGQPDGESAQKNTQGAGDAIPAQHRNIQSEVRRAFASFGANPRRSEPEVLEHRASCPDCAKYIDLSQELGTLLGTKPWETSPLNAASEEPPDWLRNSLDQSEYWRKAWARTG